MIDEQTLEERLRRTFDVLSERATVAVSSESVRFVETEVPKARPSYRRVLLATATVAVAAALVAGVVVLKRNPPTEVSDIRVPGDSTTTVTQTAPVSGMYASSRLELPSETIVAGSTVHGKLVITNNTGRRIAQPACSALQDWGVYLVNDVASSGPPAYGGPGRICNGPPSYLPVGETVLPFTFVAAYISCANAPDSYPPTPRCLPGPAMPPLPPGDYQVKVDRVPYPSASKPPVITVHVVAAGN